MALRAVDAAFAGFGIIRREPLTVAGWGLASVVLGAVFMVGFTSLGLQNIVMPVPGANPSAPPSVSMATMAPFLSLGLMGLVVGLISYSVGICAVYRAILRPEEKGWARLRLGADEFRMMGLMLILWLLLMAAYIVLIIVAVAGAAAIGVAALGGGAAAGKEVSGGAIAGIMLGVVALYFVLLIFIAWFGVTFSMAAPMTFDKRALHVFRSWKVVKGHFWPLLGCFALSTIVMLLIYIVFAGVQAALMTAVGGPTMFSALQHPQTPPSMAAYFAPGPLAVSLVLSFFGAAFYALAFAPAAAAYRDIVGVSPAVQAETFA